MKFLKRIDVLIIFIGTLLSSCASYRATDLSALDPVFVKEQEKLEAQISKLKGQLKNENFVARAPKDLVEKTKADLASAQKELEQILSRRS